MSLQTFRVILKLEMGVFIFPSNGLLILLDTRYKIYSINLHIFIGVACAKVIRERDFWPSGKLLKKATGRSSHTESYTALLHFGTWVPVITNCINFHCLPTVWLTFWKSREVVNLSQHLFKILFLQDFVADSLASRLTIKLPLGSYSKLQI